MWEKRKPKIRRGKRYEGENGREKRRVNEKEKRRIVGNGRTGKREGKGEMNDRSNN